MDDDNVIDLSFERLKRKGPIPFEIDAVKEARDKRNKNISIVIKRKEITQWPDTPEMEYFCGACNQQLKRSTDVRYCFKCGRMLDWLSG